MVSIQQVILNSKSTFGLHIKMFTQDNVVLGR